MDQPPPPTPGDAPPPPDVDVDPRVLFAAERTLLAWVRTGLAMMGFGFVVARFGLFMRELLAARGGAEPPHRLGLSLWVGTTLVALGVVVCAAAATQHWRRVRRLARGLPVRPRPVSIASAIAGVLALVGIVMAVYLLRAG